MKQSRVIIITWISAITLLLSFELRGNEPEDENTIREITRLIITTRVDENSLDEFKNSSNSEKLDIYKQLTAHFLRQEKVDSSLYFALKGMDLSTVTNSHYFSAFFHLYAGIVYNIQTRYNHALDNLRHAVIAANKTDSVRIRSDIYRNLGNVYWGMSIYDKAYDNYIISLDLARNAGLEHNVASALNNIGNVYQSVNDGEEALNYYEQALRMARSEDFPEIATISTNNIGDLHLKNDEPVKALPYFEESLNLSEELGLLMQKGVTLFNIGDVYFRLDSLNQSIVYMEESLELAGISGDRLGLAHGYLKLAEIFLKKRDYKTAYQNIIAGLSHSRTAGSTELMADGYDILNKYYYQQGILDSAYRALEQKSAIRDSFFILTSAREVLRNENRIKDEKASMEIENLKRKETVTRTLSIVITVSLVVILAVGMLSYLSLKKKSKLLSRQKSEIEEQKRLLLKINNELVHSQEDLKRMNYAKDKLLTVVSHDLKNPISAMRGYVELMLMQFDNIEPEKKKEFLQEVFNAIERVSLMVNNILYWIKNQTNGINLQKKNMNLKKQVGNNILIYKLIAKSKEISFVDKTNEEHTIYADINVFDTIIRNLISNSLKFTPAGGIIEFSSRRSRDRIILTVRDTGEGIPEEKMMDILNPEKFVSGTGTHQEKGTGMGMNLVQEFTELMGAKLEIKSKLKEGTSVSIAFPLL